MMPNVNDDDNDNAVVENRGGAVWTLALLLLVDICAESPNIILMLP